MNSLLTKKTALASLISLLIFGSSSETNAQDAPDTQSDLEVIEVTAQKRLQNLQDVPIAVSAISGKAIEEAAIKDMFDLQASVPSLIINDTQSSTKPQFSIRGVGTSSLNAGLESSVGMYVDGVYRSRQSSLINNFIDVDVVEVLRGPQGTLFGKNTPSGAISIRNVAPSHDEDDGFFEATVGNYGLLNVSFAKSLSAVEDELAFRVTAFSSMRDGFVSDIDLGKNVIGDRERFGARVQALYTPSTDLTIRIIADYAKINETCCAAFTSVSNASASGIAGKFGTDALISRPPFNATLVEPNQFSDPTVAISFLPQAKLEDYGLSAQIDWDISDALRFVSITANRNFDTFEFSDGDMTDLDLIGRRDDLSQSSISQEFRLDFSSDKLHATTGMFYFTQDLDSDFDTIVGTDFSDYALNVLLGGIVNPLLSGLSQLSAATGGAVVRAPADAVAASTYSANSRQDHTSIAVFGQLDYKLSDSLSIIAGLRYTDEEKTMLNQFPYSYASGRTQPLDISSLGDLANPANNGPGSLPFTAAVAAQALMGVSSGAIVLGTPQFAQALQAFAPFQNEGWLNQSFSAISAIRPDANETLKDEQITGTLKLTWQSDRNRLMYLSYGTGYKSGGTNTDKIAVELDPLFDAETSSAIELGIKQDFPDIGLRINAALHHTQTKDFQASAFVGTGFTLQNAGNLDAKGVEIESVWIPTDGTKINLTYSYTDISFDEFARGPCWTITPWQTGQADPGQTFLANGALAPFCDRAGDTPFGQPEMQGSLGIQQQLKFSDKVYTYAMLEYDYLGSMFTEGSNDPTSQVSGYGRLNARLFFHLEEHDTDIILWGRNITNEENQGPLSFAAPFQTGKLLSFYIEPATYGITVRTRF